MKVSILTYHDEDNYGATLQAYATYKAIEELGYQAEFIDLHFPKTDNFINRIIFSLKRFRFNKFRNKYFKNKTKTYYSVDELKQNPPQSDVYLIGSDQTWNPDISKDLALAYWLDFGTDSIRRITYAASFGKSKWEDTTYAPTEKIMELMKKFSTLLVREESAVDICRDVFHEDSKQVVDPVLLFDNYKELIGDAKIDNTKVVAYKLINSQDFYEKVRFFAKTNGLTAHSIGSVRRVKGFVCRYPVGVIGWIREFATSKYVFTDSFHGTVLSLIFQKQFIVYVGDAKRITRITSLLKPLGLDYRIVSNDVSAEKMEEIIKIPIDYISVGDLLESSRTKSWELLKHALEC